MSLSSESQVDYLDGETKQMAEYIALAEAVKQGRYFYRILLTLGCLLPIPMLYCDSSAAKARSNQQIDTQGARSIDVRFHCIRECIRRKNAY